MRQESSSNESIGERDISERDDDSLDGGDRRQSSLETGKFEELEGTIANIRSEVGDGSREENVREAGEVTCESEFGRRLGNQGRKFL